MTISVKEIKNHINVIVEDKATVVEDWLDRSFRPSKIVDNLCGCYVINTVEFYMTHNLPPISKEIVEVLKERYKKSWC